MTRDRSVPGLKGRHVAPEILDELPPIDPRAIRSRRDLRWVNALMFQPSIMAAAMRRSFPNAPPERILEIGGGDGAFSLSVAKRLCEAWPGVEVLLLDRLDLVAPETTAAFAKLGWRLSSEIADIFEWLDRDTGRTGIDCVCANLFLHHFDDDALLRLFEALLPAAPVLLATEPRRSPLALAGSSMLWAVGANDVTRHDAPASVRAGFAGNELSRLWDRVGGMPVEERGAGLFTHLFAGARRP